MTSKTKTRGRASEERNTQARPVIGHAAPAGPRSCYEIVHARVAIRSQPSTHAEAVGVLTSGKVVQGLPFTVDNNSWLQLDWESFEAHVLNEDQDAWMLINGGSIGLGVLLKPTSKPLPKGRRIRSRWYSRWRVVEDMVWIMPDPDPEQSHESKLGSKLRGDVVLGDLKTVDGHEWLKLEYHNKRAWMLIDGAAVGKDCRFMQPYTPEATSWRVLEPEVWVVPKADPDATRNIRLGTYKAGAIVTGQNVMVNGHEWLEILHGGIEAWILIDGSAVGVKRKFLEPHKAEDPGVAKWVSEHGPPLSTQWLLKQGAFRDVPRAIEEVPLPGELDVGLASKVTMLLVEPAEGGPQRKFIVKRAALFGGTVFNTDQKLLEREYRFYSEIAQQDAEGARAEKAKQRSMEADAKVREEEVKAFAAKKAMSVKEEQQRKENLQKSFEAVRKQREGQKDTFNGRWIDNDGMPICIKDAVVRGDDGQNLELMLEGKGTCFMEIGDSIFEGVLLDDRRIRWSDGSEWLRVASEEEERLELLLMMHEDVQQAIVEQAQRLEAAANRRAASSEKAAARLEERAKQLGGARHLLLAGALRVPHLLAGDCGDEDGNGFILVLEMLESPLWVRQQFAAGCSLEHAFACMNALGRFHALFSDSQELDKYPWLPVTTFGVENAEHFQQLFSDCLDGLDFMLHNTLSALGVETLHKLNSRYADMVRRLAEPPLTLVHGDFHPGNFRFADTSPPTLAAFDWQFACRARGAYDFAYFIALFAPTEVRRGSENQLGQHYLAACGRSAEAAAFINEVRAALLVVMAFFLIVNLYNFRNTETRNFLKRVGATLDDWGCHRLLE